MSRARLVLLTMTSIVAVTMIVVALVARSQHSGQSGSAAVVEELPETGIKGQHSPFKGALRPLVPSTDFALRDQNGRLVRLSDQRGRVVILSPMYTTCRDSCPLVAQQIRAALDDLKPHERKQVVAYAISVDPRSDTPESARRFLATRQVNGYLSFLLGTSGELRPVWKTYGFSEQTERVEHNSYVVLLDQRGRQRVGFPIDHLTPEGLTHDLRLVLMLPAR